MQPLIIVGTGLAGYTLAREYRKREPNAPLVLLTDDDGAFYSKPRLSNAFKDGKSADQLLQMPADEMAKQLNATILTGVCVSMIDPQANTLLVDGQTLVWSKLVLACGASPVRLPLAGDAVDQVLSVNNRLDYASFREALIGKRSVVLLGAGLIGCEFANDLAGHCFAVTVVDCAPHPLGRLLPVEGGAALQKRLEQAGVRFRFGSSIARVDRSAASLKVTLDDASVLDADMVLSAVGLMPRAELATAAGLAVQRGIVTDQMLQTSHPDIYALGDVVQIDGWVLPFVMPLMAQARALAATLSGQPTPVHYPAFPVTVKTPACPTVICPPASGIDGQWLNKTLPDGWRGEYRSTGGELHGFALMGDTAIRDRLLLAKQIKDWLPALPHLSTTECLPA